jgi:hypothetical protein
MKQKLPYQTRNTALAVVAFLFRIPVNRHKYYTPEMLESKRLTAKEAFQRGILGQVDYSIDTDGDPDHSKIIAAFNDEKLRIDEGQDECPLEIDPEIAARFAARVLYARKNFFSDLFKLVPFLRIQKDGSTQTSKKAENGSYTTTSPGFKDIRIDATDEVKKHFNL